MFYPISLTQKEILSRRNDVSLCHPKYTGPTLGKEESIISNGEISGISTVMECCDGALLFDSSIVCAHKEENIIIDPQNLLVPDMAGLINKYLATFCSLTIHPFEWTINGSPVGGGRSQWNAVTGERTSKDDFAIDKDDVKRFRNLIQLYASNVMDAAYQTNKSGEDLPLTAHFLPAHEEHRRIPRSRKGFSGSFRDNIETLEGLLFHVDTAQQILNQLHKDVSENDVVISPSMAKRLLIMFISNKIGVPYIPISYKEINEVIK